MLKFVVWSSCLALVACGKGDVAETSAVTNGKLVLGIVPIKGGESEQDQRYRLLICKKQSEYNEQVFADTNKCRSALLTQHGEEVDFVGDKLDSAPPNIAHLHAKAASEARVIGLAPIAQRNQSTRQLYSPLLRVIRELSLISYYKDYNARARRKRSGDDGKRSYPAPVAIHFWSPNEYSRTDIITSQNWQIILTFDFQNMVSLEKTDDLRTILVAMARFYKLKVNEDALQLATL